MRNLLASLSLLCLGAMTPSIPSPYLPVERLLSNLHQYIKQSPEDHLLYYHVARTHYLALLNQSDVVVQGSRRSRSSTRLEPAGGFEVRNNLRQLRREEADRRARKKLAVDKNTKISRALAMRLSGTAEVICGKLERSDWRPEPVSKEVLLQHAKEGMVYFDTAIRMAPGEALYHLGRASLGLLTLDRKNEGRLPSLGEADFFAEISYAKVRDQFYQAFTLSLERDLEIPSLPVGYRWGGVRRLISHEAGRNYLQLTEETADLAEGEVRRIAEVKKGMADLGEIPVTIGISPIIFGGGSRATLRDLLAPDRPVIFDLDGDGQRELWPWVQPDTAILVWDPYEEANITSGHQLFGSVTFQLFHRDGYAALSLLDDDQDGELRNLELTGLAIWRDQNSDGRSTPDEVRPLWQEGICALSTRSTVNASGVLQSSNGVSYYDGRKVPSFDWVTEPWVAEVAVDPVARTR